MGLYDVDKISICDNFIPSCCRMFFRGNCSQITRCTAFKKIETCTRRTPLGFRTEFYKEYENEAANRQKTKSKLIEEFVILELGPIPWVKPMN